MRNPAAFAAAGMRTPVDALLTAGRIYLGVVFIAAALPKIADPYAFGLSIASYQFLPLWAINPFAILLPWVELVVGAALALGLWIKEHALLTIGMLCMFIVALLWALGNGLQMSCGCFSSQDAADEIGWRTVARDVAWLVIAVAVLAKDRGRFGLDGVIARHARKKEERS